MSGALLIWWSALSTAAAVNVVAWSCAAWRLYRARPHTPAGHHTLRVRLLWLAAIYVLGCGFRSVLPMLDVPRICLHDNGISRIVVGRSVATIAELAFALQLALWLRQASAGAGGRVAAVASRLVVPCISLAEMCCWSAVLTGNYLFHAFENSLWTLAAVVLVAGLIPLWAHARGRTGLFYGLAAACAAGYVAYMVCFDVPMYVARWRANVAAHHPYLALDAGFGAILRRCAVVREWSAWRQDVPWLTLYFTVAVWMSLALVHAPIASASHRKPGE